jgi:hypothetical protein
MLVLFETPAGYAIFRISDEKKLTEPENTWTGFAGLDLGRHQDVGGLEIYELEEWFEKTQRHILKVHEQL